MTLPLRSLCVGVCVCMNTSLYAPFLQSFEPGVRCLQFGEKMFETTKLKGSRASG